MPDEHMRQTFNRAQNEVLCTRIFRVAEAGYRNWVDQAALFTAIERSTDTPLDDLNFNAHYLSEKGLLRIEGAKGKRKGGWHIKLTARGIDFLEGRLEEIGLASPDLAE